MNTYHRKQKEKISDRDRILKTREESGGLAPKRLTPLEIDLKERLTEAESKIRHLEQSLEGAEAAEQSIQLELNQAREDIQVKEREVQSERDRLANERKRIDAERRENIKFRGDAIRLRKEIDLTFIPSLKKQKELIEKAQQKRRDEVNRHLETKAELEKVKAQLKGATEQYRGIKSDPQQIDVSNMTKEEVEELRKKLTKRIKEINGNGNGKGDA